MIRPEVVFSAIRSKPGRHGVGSLHISANYPKNSRSLFPHFQATHNLSFDELPLTLIYVQLMLPGTFQLKSCQG